MKLVITTLIFLSSSILSGIIVIFGINELTDISFRIWFLLFSLILFVLWKYRFHTEKRFKYFLLKNFIKLSKFFRRDIQSISDLEDKAVKLWKICLKNKSTQISCSIPKQVRQLQKDNMLIILAPTNRLDYLMTIIDLDSSKRCLYEITISHRLSESIIMFFDNENEKRMRLNEQERRKSIYDDLDKLLKQEEIDLLKKTTQLKH